MHTLLLSLIVTEIPIVLSGEDLKSKAGQEAATKNLKFTSKKAI
ncbi:hypothetical protein [Pedobacter sp. KBS0701]|nr:hypothetical protein [Pedobacter sp. KBS0701]